MLRRIIFWVHLPAGLLAGLSFSLLCLTGIVITLEHPVVEWAERAYRRVLPPANAEAQRLPLAELARRFHQALPKARINAVLVTPSPDAAVMIRYGQDSMAYANPYTGEIKAPPKSFAQRFMRGAVELHRWLLLDGPKRPWGKGITDTANLVLCAACLSGLYLWWPRRWTRRGFRAISVVNLSMASARTRDWNKHHAIGVWCAPLLLVISLTALPMSYRWAGDLIFRAAGEKPPQPPPMPGGRADQAMAEGLLDRMLEAAAAETPGWTFAALRMPGAPGQNGRIVAALRADNLWPKGEPLKTLHFHSKTGEIAFRDEVANFPPGRRFRIWTRFLHTGEALGWPGQVAAALAAFGGLVLVYTGTALAWRRFFRQNALHR